MTTDSEKGEDVYKTSTGAKVWVKNAIEIFLSPQLVDDPGRNIDRRVPCLKENDSMLFVIGSETAIEQSKDCAPLATEELAGIANDIDSIVLPWLAGTAGAADTES